MCNKKDSWILQLVEYGARTCVCTYSWTYLCSKVILVTYGKLLTWSLYCYSTKINRKLCEAYYFSFFIEKNPWVFHRPLVIWYDSVYLTCSKKLMGSQLSLPHGINEKLQCETNKNLAIANRSRVSCAHNTLGASIGINITPWPWNLG